MEQRVSRNRSRTLCPRSCGIRIQIVERFSKMACRLEPVAPVPDEALKSLFTPLAGNRRGASPRETRHPARDPHHKALVPLENLDLSERRELYFLHDFSSI